MVRIAVTNDLKDINRLGSMLHSNFESTFHMETEIDSHLAIVFVSECNNRINGYLYALNFLDNIDLLSIVVDENDRMNGIGSMLIEELIKVASDKTITLEVSTDNVSALRLYEKYGFIKVGKRDKYYKNNNAYIMKWGNRI